MKTIYKEHFLYLLTFVCLFGASLSSIAQGSFGLTDGYVSSIDGASNVNFTLTFNQVPDFFTVDPFGRQAYGFQFYIATTTNIAIPYPLPPYASLVRGGEIHVAGTLPVRNDSPSDSDPNSGGWGSIRGSVSYSLVGTTMMFSIPADVLNVQGPFAYTLQLDNYGVVTSYYPALSGSAIMVPEPSSFSLAAISMLGIAISRIRRSRLNKITGAGWRTGFRFCGSHHRPGVAELRFYQS